MKSKIIYRNYNEVYLIRYSIFTCKYFSIKIHKILKSDDACLHDHPWSFITFILKGGYVEHTPEGTKIRSRFSLLYRPAKWSHRLEIHQTAWTLVFTSKYKRQWGFWTPRGWEHWTKYRSTGQDICE